MTGPFSKTIADLYTAEDLAYFRENYGNAPWMVHVAGPGTCLTRDGAVPFTEKSAREAAAAYNALGKREREASEFAPEIRATVFHFGAPVGEDATVTTVRKALIAESYEHLDAMKKLTAKRRAGQALTAAELDLFDALAKVNAYSYFLAGLLRVIDEQHGAEEGRHVAYLIDTVRDVGTEVLEFANDDLDERARGAVA